METITKLKYKVYNKGIDLEIKLIEQLEEYDEKVVSLMAKELESLEAEYEHLKLNGNVITSFNINEYQQNQRRLKELPLLISDLRRDKLKAIEDRQALKDSLCKGIYAEIGKDYIEEFNSNMEVLKYEYDKALTKLIEVDKQMEEMEREYNYGLKNVIKTKGIYLTINRYPFINQIMEDHNLNNKTLNLYYAK